MFKPDSPKTPEEKGFEVEKYPVANGFIYEIHFRNETEAQEAVKSFWAMREGSELTRKGLESGMLKGSEHQITSGDRTHPRKANSQDLTKHPGKSFVVQFNGNTEALGPRGEASLRKLGFIE